MVKKKGQQTYLCDRKVYIRDCAAIVGPREKDGPLGEYFDEVQSEDFDEKSWEKAEAKFTEATFQKLLNKTKIKKVLKSVDGNTKASLIISIISLDGSIYGICFM